MLPVWWVVGLPGLFFFPSTLQNMLSDRLSDRLVEQNCLSQQADELPAHSSGLRRLHGAADRLSSSDRLVEELAASPGGPSTSLAD